MEIQSFLTYLSTEKRCSPHTLDSYTTDLEQFTAFCKRQYEVQDVGEVTQPMVRSWLAELLNENYKASSVHRKLSSVNAYYRFLLKVESVSVNPAKLIIKPKLPKRLPVFVDESGAKELYEIKNNHKESPQRYGRLNEFSDCRDQIIVTLLYETGIRRAELLNLKDVDFDFYNGQMKVLGKRNKMRYVPVGLEMIQKIKDYMAKRDNLKFKNSSEYFLVSDQGKKISKSFVYLKVKDYLSQVTTIQRKSPHVLRHTFATHMLNNGADLNVIKEILGHSSLAATQVYTHNSIEKLKSIHKKMHPRNN